MLEKLERLDTKRGFYTIVIGAVVIWVVMWNLYSSFQPKKAQTGSFRSESDQLRSKSELYSAKLQDRKVELDFRMQNRKLDFQTEFLAKQQKEEDLRRVNQVIEAMTAGLPQAEKGQQQLDEVLTSNTGMVIASADDLVRLFGRLYNQQRVRPDDIRFRLKQAQELRDEMAKEDPVTRAETRGDELGLIEKWDSEAKSSLSFYTQAHVEVAALVQEAQMAESGSAPEVTLTDAVALTDGGTRLQQAKSIVRRRGPRITLEKAIQRLQEQDVHDQLFPRPGTVTHPAIQ
jgi:hypothetical protein